MRERLITLGTVIVVVIILLATYWVVTRPAGAGLTAASKQLVVFRIYAPEAKSVFVSGSFNAWQTVEHRLEKKEGGLWEARVRIAPGRYEYKFVVDSSWVPDPTNPMKVPVPLPFTGYNSVLEVTDSSNTLSGHR